MIAFTTWKWSAVFALLVCTAPAQIFVSPTGSDATGDGSAAMPFKTIGFAAASAPPGGVLRLSPGTFGDDEQVVLGGKDLTIVGAGVGQTRVVPHPSLVISLPTGPIPGANVDQRPVLVCDGPASIEVRDLTIDGDFRMPASGHLVGVFARDGADVTLVGVEVTGVRADPLDGSPEPAGIVVRGDDNLDPCDVVMRSCRVLEWGKVGIAVGANATLSIEYCEVRGAGPVTALQPAQFCLDITDGATARLSHNYVAEASQPSSSGGVGLRFSNAGACLIYANDVARCDDNIFIRQVPQQPAEVKVKHNRSTQAYGKAVRIIDNTLVTVQNNVLHAAALAQSPVWDTTGGGNVWTGNNYSDADGTSAYIIPGGVNIDLDARRNCEEFSGGVQPVLLGVTPRDLVVDDFNGGDLDFAVIDSTAPAELVVGLAAGGSFNLSQIVFGSANAAAATLAAGEFNGLPGTDLVAVTLDITGGATDNRFYVFANNGTGGFAVLHDEMLPAGTIGVRDVAVADVDGNGVDDFVLAYVGNATNPGGGAVFTNGGGGTAWTSVALPGPTLQCKAVALGPLDPGNGSIDVALTEGSGSSGLVRIYTNDGFGVFAEASVSPLAVASNPTAVAVADVDADGSAEVLVTSWGAAAPSGLGTLTVFDNQLPTAMPGVPMPTDVGPTQIALGDVEPSVDGLDAVVVNFTAADLTFMGKVSDTGPAYASICLVGTQPNGAVLADMNGDSRTDLVVTDRTVGRLWIASGVTLAREDVYGEGCPSARGPLPIISCTGDPPVALPVNSTFGLRLSNARPNQPAALLVSGRRGSSAPCQLAVGAPFVAVPVATDALGSFHLSLPIVETVGGFLRGDATKVTRPATSVGDVWYGQWVVLDRREEEYATAPLGESLRLRQILHSLQSLSGTAQSQGLRVRVGI